MCAYIITCVFNFKISVKSSVLVLASIDSIYIQHQSFNIVNDHLFLSSDAEEQKHRFQVELEFVQCLGNPNYLNCKCTPLILELKARITMMMIVKLW